MPLISLGKGKVVYERPAEPVKIGRLVCLNETINARKRRAEIDKLPINMSMIQKAYLFNKGK
jgi:hypothetical protein